MEYGQNGEIRIFVPADSLFAPSALINFTAKSAEVKRADALAAAESIYYRLDNVKTVKDLRVCLADMENINNGQFILDSALIETLPAAEKKKLFEKAHSSGIKIMADISEFSAQRAAQEGFDGRVLQKDGKLYVEDFSSGVRIEAGIVEGYSDMQSLSNALKKAKGIKIISGTKLIDALSGGDRSIIDRYNVLKLLKSGLLLGVLKENVNSEEFLEKSAYNIDARYLPELSEESVEKLVMFAKEGQTLRVLETLAMKSDNPFMIRFNNISGARTSGAAQVINSAQAINTAQAEKTFLLFLTERILIRKRLSASLENKTFEKTLGKALRFQAEAGNADKNDWSIGESFKEEHQGFTQADLKNEILKYTGAAFENKDPQALKAVVELITVCASEKRKFALEDAGTSVELDGIRKILTAA
jgi:hypothetical protein